MRSRPAAPLSTPRTGLTARGMATTASNAHHRPDAAATATARANGTVIHAAYNHRVTDAPTRTAKVRLPAVSSVAMSRRLLTTSNATASRPTGTPARTDSDVSRPSCTYAVPAVATRPKKTKTNSSPNPA